EADGVLVVRRVADLISVDPDAARCLSPQPGVIFLSDRLLELGGVGPACLEFLHCLLAAHGVAPILRALGPHHDFPAPWHALRSLGRAKDTTNKMMSFEHVVVIGRPLAIPAFAGARQRQRANPADRAAGCRCVRSPRPMRAAAQRQEIWAVWIGRTHHRDYKITSARALPNALNCGADYSKTSSAAITSPGGIVSPKALALLRLMNISTFEDRYTGRSPGFSPVRIRPV